MAGRGNKLTDDLCAHPLSFLAGEGRCQATGDDIDQDRLGLERSNGLAEEVFGLDTLDEAHVRARVSSKLQARDRLVHAEHLRRVRAADDHDVRAAGDLVARNDRRTDAREELLAGDNLLAHQVSAALRLHLVLDVQPCDAGAVVFVNGAGDVGGTAESRRQFLVSFDCCVSAGFTYRSSPSVGIGDNRSGGA